MGKGFYTRLAWQNIRRNKRVYLPHLIATGVMSGACLLISGLMFSKSLESMPAGDAAAMMFRFGMVIFGIFTFFFMLYINNFLIKQRKREFGLYGILGLSRHQVGKVLFRENLFVIGGGLLLGIAVANLFGRLLFLALLKLLNATSGEGHFEISLVAYMIAVGLFAGVFVVTTVTNSLRVRTANPIELLNSDKKGEKDSKLVLPLSIFGVICLGAAYYFAWTIKQGAIALGLFFPLALLVIIATYALFKAGSIVFLRLLRSSKRFYYKPKNFVTIGAMFHRMRQNARGLATICILSTMLVVTLSTTLSLYIGREQIAEQLHPYNVAVHMNEGASEREAEALLSHIKAAAANNGVIIHADESKLINSSESDAMGFRNNVLHPGDTVSMVSGVLRINDDLVFDADGDFESCLSFIEDTRAAYLENFPEHPGFLISDVFTTKLEGYGAYGGLLFLGVFFSILFLCLTVLIMYFKQITEGYEDRAQFDILKKVGMDDAQVKATINRQVLYVFFLPLATMLLHMVFASRIESSMLQSFSLNNWPLVIGCSAAVSGVFAAIYLIVYRLTAKTYYSIVK